MAKKRKDLGDYNKIIDDYLASDTIHTKQGLRLKLGISRDYIVDCQRRKQKWKEDFIKKWKWACNVMLNEHLQFTLSNQNLRWEYITKWEFRKEFEEQEVSTDNIIINIDAPRVIQNE